MRKSMRARGADSQQPGGGARNRHRIVLVAAAVVGCAGLVDRVQVTLFPVITGRTGLDPIFQGADDFDLELLETRTLDGHIQELVYRPTRHG